MAISNYVPNSRISQAGVCTSTTRPTSPYEGQVIYESDTNRVLVWEGAAWVAPNSQTANPPGLEMIMGIGCSSGGTASNGVVTIGSAQSSVTVTNAFSANYDNYRILIADVDSSIQDSTCFMRFNNSTGTTYAWATDWRGFSAGASGANSNGLTNLGIGVGFSGVSDDMFFSIDVLSPNKAKWTSVNSLNQNADYRTFYGGVDKANNQHTGFSLHAPASNTLTGGTIRVYGYRN